MIAGFSNNAINGDLCFLDMIKPGIKVIKNSENKYNIARQWVSMLKNKKITQNAIKKLIIENVRYLVE